MHGKVGLRGRAMQADADSVIHVSCILLGFIVAQVCHFAMHQDTRLPLILAVAGPHAHEAAGSLPAAEPPTGHLEQDINHEVYALL